MAADQKNRKSSKKNRVNISCFSFKSCFGFSHKQHELSMEKNSHEKELVKYGSGRARTVPMSQPTFKTTSFVVDSSKEIHVFDDVQTKGQLVTPPAQEVTNKKVHDMLKNNKNLSKSSQLAMGSIKFDKNSTTQEANWKNTVKLLHSISLPPPRPKREKSTAGVGGGNKVENDGQLIVSNQLDPIIGALIMMVALIVMLIWGKICAIICSAAWFYIIPRFRARNDMFPVNNLKTSSNLVDVDSWEYKNKVVLEGFLERNHYVRI